MIIIIISILNVFQPNWVDWMPDQTEMSQLLEHKFSIHLSVNLEPLIRSFTQINFCAVSGPEGRLAQLSRPAPLSNQK